MIGGGADVETLSLAFDDNRLASALFGQFDQHLAAIEQKLDVEAVARGNEVTIRGQGENCAQARQALQHLYQRLKRGHEIRVADVDGAVRLARAQDRQMTLPAMDRPQGVRQIATRKKTVEARSPTQNAYIRAMEDNELVFGIGPAGTGKTFLAVAYAAQLLEQGRIERIILSRPAVEAGERLGFLPGDMKEKVDPYLRPLYDSLYEMISPEKVDRHLQSGVIEVAPLAFMRGRTLTHSVAILDEAQNTTAMQMKMFLTRLGEGSRMIVTGDPSQVDLPGGVTSGLREASRVLSGVEGVAMVRFNSADVVRHELVARIVAAYDAQQPAGDTSE